MMETSRSRAASVPSSVRSLLTDGFATPPEEAEQPLAPGAPYASINAGGGDTVVISSASIRTARSAVATERGSAESDGDETIDHSNASVTAVKSVLSTGPGGHAHHGSSHSDAGGAGSEPPRSPRWVTAGRARGRAAASVRYITLTPVARSRRPPRACADSTAGA